MQNRQRTRRREAIRMLLGALFAGMVALGLSGCGGGGGGGGNSTGTTVSGMVKDSSNGDQPVGGATVTINGLSTITTDTDHASADNPVGSFILTGGALVGATSATVTVGNQPQTIAFSPSLTKGANSALELIINIGQVRGKVLLPNGQPASGAFVSLAVNGDNTETASDGTFLLVNVPLGTTEVAAVLGTASKTQTITVTNGVAADITLQLVDDPNPNPPSIPYTLSGKVVLSGVGAAAGTQVTLFRNGVQLTQAFTDSSGAYGFYVPVGTYTIQFRRTGFQDTSAGPVTVTNPQTALQVPDVTMQQNP